MDGQSGGHVGIRRLTKGDFTLIITKLCFILMYFILLSSLNVFSERSFQSYKLSSGFGVNYRMGSKSIRIIDVVKPYDGEGDIESWILKEEMVVKSQKIKDEELILPMLLEKEALAVYLELSEEDKNSADRIKERLRKVFGENPFLAFRRLCMKKWNGESMDVYITEIRRLARSANVGGDMLIKRFFVNGLPENVAKEVRAMVNIEECGVDEMLSRARAVSTSEDMGNFGAAAVFSKHKPVNINNFDLRCYSCGGRHLKQDCYRNNIRCFSCGKMGHISRMCNSKRTVEQGNDE